MLPGREGDAAAGGLGPALRVPVRQAPDPGRETAAPAAPRSGATAVLVLRRELLVPEQTVRPQVRDQDLEIVLARTDGVRDVDSVGRFPQDPKTPAIEPDLRDHLHPAEVEEQALARRGDTGRN